MSTIIDEVFLQMGITPSDEHLEHHGVKGMKWGVRRAEKAQSEAARAQSYVDRKKGNASRSNQRRADSLKDRADRKTAKAAGDAPEKHSTWKKQAKSADSANAVFQEAAKTFGPAAKAINNDPRFKGVDLSLPANRGLARAYDIEISRAFNEHLAQISIDKTMATTTKGIRAYIFQYDTRTGLMRGVEHRAVQHADNEIAFKATLNDLHQVESLDPVVLVHEDEVGDFLVHFGVKGMKWGVRKESSSSSSGGESVVNPRHLSDSDLRAAVNRMQLERQFTQLQSERVQAGNGFAKQILKDIGKQQVRRVATKAADLAIEAALTKAGKKTNNPALGEIAKRMKPKKK